MKTLGVSSTLPFVIIGTEFKNRRSRRIERSKYRRLERKAPIIDLRTYKLSTLSVTGQSASGCYARDLGSCEGPMSREHPISKNILSQIGNISCKGIPWLSHIEGSLSPEAIAVKSLCQTHNSFLAPLDAMAGKAFPEFGSWGVEQPRSVIIPGPQFEQFMLKMLFGLLSTNHFTEGARRYSTSDLDPKWLRILFGLESMPTDAGLFIAYEPGMRIEIKNGVSAAPVFLGDKIGGLQLELCGFRFLFSLFPKVTAFNPRHLAYEWILLHPNAFNKAPYPQKIEFDWRATAS